MSAAYSQSNLSRLRQHQYGGGFGGFALTSKNNLQSQTNLSDLKVNFFDKNSRNSVAQRGFLRTPSAVNAGPR